MNYSGHRRGLSLILLIIGSAFLSVGCGYQLGSPKPAEMLSVKTLHVEMPQNRTQYPRLEAQLKNHLVDGFLEDGQYQLAPSSTATAKLSTTIRNVNYRQIRSSRTDALLPLELLLEVVVDWEVVSSDDAQSLMNGSSKGTTRFFLDDNLQTSRMNALPDALKTVARRVTFSLSCSYN